MSDEGVDQLNQSAGVVKHDYEMKISMSVLEALGINLYSNAAAVVSELVANAWDADANLVQINWNAAGENAFVEIIDDWGVTLLVDSRYQEGTTGNHVYESQDVHAGVQSRRGPVGGAGAPADRAGRA